MDTNDREFAAWKAQRRLWRLSELKLRLGLAASMHGMIRSRRQAEFVVKGLAASAIISSMIAGPGSLLYEHAALPAAIATLSFTWAFLIMLARGMDVAGPDLIDDAIAALEEGGGHDEDAACLKSGASERSEGGLAWDFDARLAYLAVRNLIASERERLQGLRKAPITA